MPISKVLMCKMHKRIITQNVGSTVVSEDCMRSHVTSVSTSWTFGLNRRTYWENSFLLIFETLLGADICGLFDYLI